MLSLLLITVISCKPAAVENGGKSSATITPVRVINPAIDTITEYIDLNATSSFLKKDFIKSNANGYVENVNISIGDIIQKGKSLFTLQTKESRALGNFKSKIDSSLHFSGIINIPSPKDGVVSAISHQAGDYVQDGEQLAILSEQSSLVFLIDAPYEFHTYLTPGKDCFILLPDGGRVAATVASALPLMDVSSQTQNYIIRPLNPGKLPEGLIAKVQIVKNKKQNALVVPKSAVLTDEKQENFWVMKLFNDSMVAKIPIQKGMENAEKVEILSPGFKKSDRVLISGNYGLPDTAQINIVK